MLMMTDERLAQITERLALWANYDDSTSFTPADADELVREVNYLRAQHQHEVRLLRRCRDELIRVSDEYSHLLSRAQAWAAHNEAELNRDARVVQDQAGEEPQ